MKSEVVVNGYLTDYFETGTEGTYWAIQDENYINKDSPYPYSHKGRHLIENKNHLTIYYPDGGIICWEGVIRLEGLHYFKHSFKFKLLNYFDIYIKKHQTGIEQLNLGGLWVHSLPLNVDLALWFKIFVTDSGKWKAVLRKT